MPEGSRSWEVQGYLESCGGRLTIDGVDAVSLVEAHGSPLYVFSERRISDNTRSLRQAAEAVFPRVKICYASKANSNMAVVRTVLRAGGDIEVNSGGELYKAKKLGFRPDQIIFNGVSKTDEEIRDAVEYGILALNVDSLNELEQVTRVARTLGKRANVAIRIVPEIVTRSHIGLQTGLLSSKFGLSPSQVEEAFRRALAASDAINLAGIHIHLGSQTPDPHPFARSFAEMWSFMVDLYRKTGHRLTHINIGGGLPINYLPDTSMAVEIDSKERAMLSAHLDPNKVFRETLAEIVGKDGEGLLDGITIVLEPGRRIVGDTGLVLTRVCNIKERPETGDTWLLTDAGYSLMISLSTYKWYYHLISASRAEEPHSTPYKVAGPLCDSGDVYFDLEHGSRLPNYRLLPAGTNVGEVLALLNTGAYALDQSSQYNGRPRPAVVMVRESGEVSVVRRRETYEDLHAFDVW
jgi:D-ornithine/D-lysine decarboxylase